MQDYWTIIIYTVEAYDESYSITTCNAPLILVSGVEYWKITKANGGSNVAISTYWNSNSGVQNYVDLRVAKYNGTEWDEETDCQNPSGDNSAGHVSTGNNTPDTWSVANLTDGDNFITIGSISNLNSLPITLLNFSGQATNNGTLLSWTTGSEINNNYFQIEKSTDGKEFFPIGVIPGNGNSLSIKSYSYLDKGLELEESYYRLKQVDYDGGFEYFKIINVKNKKTPSYNITQLENIIIILPNKPSLVEIFDCQGRNVFSQNSQQELFIPVKNFRPGIYIIKVDCLAQKFILK